jgi:hypothetical protein
MTTQTTVGQFVVGKNANVIVKVADLDQAKMMEVLTLAMNGQVVGIQPQLPVNKKVHIEEAQAFVDDLNAKLQMITAAPTKESKGDVKTMKETEELKPKAAVHKNMDRAARNSNVGRFQSHAETVANQRFLDLGEYGITVVGIEWFAKADRFNRIGSITLQLPEGYADVSYYDNSIKKFVWYDFCDFSLNQFKSVFNPPAGSGELTLAIKEKWGQLAVTMPKSPNKNNPKKPYDKLRTRDIRFGKPHTDNNGNFEAAVSAYLQFYAGEFLQANPRNRHGIDQHCGSCKYNMYIPGFDGTDEQKDGYYNTLNTSDTIEMVQWGQEIPRRYCMINRELVDLEIVKEVNELAAFEETTYYNEEGQLRYLKPNEILVAGRAVNKYVALKEGTADRCADCPFYHNNAPKTDAQVAKEKAEGADYVSKYWSEGARSERMAIQTLVTKGGHPQWETVFPGEVDNAQDFRVFGIGGVVIYGSDEILDAAFEGGVMNQVPQMEGENHDETYAAKVVEIIQLSCNRFYEMTEEKLANILDMIDNKPAELGRMEKRWNGAVARLAATIMEYQGE